MSIVSTVPSKVEPRRKVALLCEEYTRVLDHVYVYCLGEGYAVDWSYLYQKAPTDRDVVAPLSFKQMFPSVRYLWASGSYSSST